MRGVGGGLVSSNAFTASSNLSGASDSRSVLRVLIFFFVRVFTHSFSTPSRQRLVVFYEPINVSRHVRALRGLAVLPDAVYPPCPDGQVSVILRVAVTHLFAGSNHPPVTT
jgi:hypothetical protein